MTEESRAGPVGVRVIISLDFEGLIEREVVETRRVISPFGEMVRVIAN